MKSNYASITLRLLVNESGFVREEITEEALSRFKTFNFQELTEDEFRERITLKYKFWIANSSKSAVLVYRGASSNNKKDYYAFVYNGFKIYVESPEADRPLNAGQAGTSWSIDESGKKVMTRNLIISSPLERKPDYKCIEMLAKAFVTADNLLSPDADVDYTLFLNI